MNDKSIYFIATLMGGAVLPVQVALNALLRRYVGQPMQVTFISYLAGTLTFLAICWLARYPLPAIAAMPQTSWWMWLGGCLGTLYVWSTIFAAAKIGTALTLALTIVGQMICALFLDHYGVIGPLTSDDVLQHGCC